MKDKQRCGLCSHWYYYPVELHHTEEECATNRGAAKPDAEKRLDALAAWFLSEIEIDGNPGKAEAYEYARFALEHGTNPLNLTDWAKWVPTAVDPLCAIASWADDAENGVYSVYAARGVRFGLQDAFELARATHLADDFDGNITMLGMTLNRRADGTTCRWNDDKSVVTEWVFKL